MIKNYLMGKRSFAQKELRQVEGEIKTLKKTIDKHDDFYDDTVCLSDEMYTLTIKQLHDKENEQRIKSRNYQKWSKWCRRFKVNPKKHVFEVYKPRTRIVVNASTAQDANNFVQKHYGRKGFSYEWKGYEND